MQVDTTELKEQLSQAGISVNRAGFDPRRRQVWIELPSGDDAAALLNLIARYVPEGEPFYQRIFGGGRDPRAWQYSVAPVDKSKKEMGGISEELNWKPTPRFGFTVYCLFPPEDLPLIVELLRDYNAASVSS